MEMGFRLYQGIELEKIFTWLAKTMSANISYSVPSKGFWKPLQLIPEDPNSYYSLLAKKVQNAKDAVSRIILPPSRYQNTYFDQLEVDIEKDFKFLPCQIGQLTFYPILRLSTLDIPRNTLLQQQKEINKIVKPRFVYVRYQNTKGSPEILNYSRDEQTYMAFLLDDRKHFLTDFCFTNWGSYGTGWSLYLGDVVEVFRWVSNNIDKTLKYNPQAKPFFRPVQVMPENPNSYYLQLVNKRKESLKAGSPISLKFQNIKGRSFLSNLTFSFNHNNTIKPCQIGDAIFYPTAQKLRVFVKGENIYPKFYGLNFGFDLSPDDLSLNPKVCYSQTDYGWKVYAHLEPNISEHIFSLLVHAVDPENMKMPNLDRPMNPSQESQPIFEYMKQLYLSEYPSAFNIRKSMEYIVVSLLSNTRKPLNQRTGEIGAFVCSAFVEVNWKHLEALLVENGLFSDYGDQLLESKKQAYLYARDNQLEDVMSELLEDPRIQESVSSLLEEENENQKDSPENGVEE